MDIKIFVIINEKDAKKLLSRLEKLSSPKSKKELEKILKTLGPLADRGAPSGFQ